VKPGRTASIACRIVAFLCLALCPSAGAGEVGVATAEADATRVALTLLADGGNAVDAAVGAAIALAVVHPEAGNLGGGGFAIVHIDDQIAALDFRETAPAAATATMYLDANDAPLPDASRVGPLAAGVPGSPAGYHELHRRFGRLPWRDVVAPAIALARDGFEISWQTAATLAGYRDRLERFPESAARWLPGGVPPGAGERIRLPALAATLTGYAERGPKAITAGATATAIEAASRRHGGILTAADLDAYRPVWRQPLRFESHGWSFAAMPLPSSGGLLVAEALALLERLGYGALPRDSAARAHLLIEAWRRAFADRFDLGDRAGSEAALEALLVPARLDRLAATIDLRRAARSSQIRSARPAAEPTETTNISVVDAEGGAIALTTTLNDLFGCGLWVPEAGLFLNSEMDDFATAPGVPNLYGLMQGSANRVHPGRRPLSSMSPTVGWRGTERIAIGGRGGSRIPTAVVQTLLSLWDGDSASAAVARRRLHHQWLPDRVEIEKGALGARPIADLQVRGHEFDQPVHTGKVNLVVRRADGSIDAGGDPRGFESARSIELSTAERRP
jgi:gamma-glutamyltranspeptidase/glutathione hydrolase